MPHEYLLDFHARGSLRITANSAAEARQILDNLLDCANVNFGAFPNGDPALGELTAYARHVAEIDGTETPDLNAVRAFETASAALPGETDWEALARANGWVSRARDPHPLPGQPIEAVLYHKELDRVLPFGDWKAACADIGVGPEGES